MDPDILRMLSILSRPLTNQVEYSQRLINCPDEFVRAAGFAALLDLAALPRPLWEEAVVESRHGMVASRAVKFFAANFEYGLGERAAAAFEPFDKPALAEGMRALLQMDSRRLVEVNARQFLNAGGVEHLIAAAEQGRRSRARFPSTIRRGTTTRTVTAMRAEPASTATSSS